jgi:hypothetical protein
VTFIYDAYGNQVERQAYDGSTSSIQRYVYDGWDTNKSGAIGTENFDQTFELNGANGLVMRRLIGAGFDLAGIPATGEMVLGPALADATIARKLQHQFTTCEQ